MRYDERGITQAKREIARKGGPVAEAMVSSIYVPREEIAKLAAQSVFAVENVASDAAPFVFKPTNDRARAMSTIGIKSRNRKKGFTRAQYFKRRGGGKFVVEKPPALTKSGKPRKQRLHYGQDLATKVYFERTKTNKKGETKTTRSRVRSYTTAIKQGSPYTGGARVYKGSLTMFAAIDKSKSYWLFLSNMWNARFKPNFSQSGYKYGNEFMSRALERTRAEVTKRIAFGFAKAVEKGSRLRAADWESYR